MRRFVLAALTLAMAPLLTTSSAAQEVSRPPEIFQKLVGNWDGDAWFQVGPGNRQQLRQREWLEPVAGGTVIAIKGLGTRTTGEGVGETVHDAFAVVHVGHDGKTPLMRAFTGQGHWMDIDLTVRSDGFSWALSDPRAGLLRYDMHLDGQGRWVEAGFRSGDNGKTWTKFMEMTLTRTK
ncbi:MAG: hypothetical protein H0W15_05000 [Gemmatimonadales bacterium]|nr:hypothetical protein [Gemmatimonadales bacterium]